MGTSTSPFLAHFRWHSPWKSEKPATQLVQVVPDFSQVAQFCSAVLQPAGRQSGALRARWVRETAGEDTESQPAYRPGLGPPAAAALPGAPLDASSRRSGGVTPLRNWYLQYLHEPSLVRI